MSAAMEQGSWGLKGADRKLKYAEQLHGMKISKTRCCKDGDQRSGLGSRSPSVPNLVSQTFPIARSSGVGVPVSMARSPAVPAVPTKFLWNAVSALQPLVMQLLNPGYNKELVSRYMRDERQPLQCLG